MESDLPEGELAAAADVVFVNLQGLDVGQTMRTLTAHCREQAQIVLFAEKGQMTALEKDFSRITDIWMMPMSDEEIRFRLQNWQRTYKMSKDYWETSHFLEATINGVPNLIWYKDKEGLHEKVNDSFCKTVRKTKEQVEGRDHYFIWDVDPNDPANEGNDCMESDMEVMRKQMTCVSEETVNTGDGIRLMTTYKSPLYDLDGSVMGTVGVGIDVTQERAYEEEIVRKNHTLETIFTSIDCGVLCHSLDGKTILNVNQAALNILGYKSMEELQEGGFDTIAPTVLDEDKPHLRECIQKLKKVGDSVSIEYRVRHTDGELLHIMGNVKLLEENGVMFYQRFLLDSTAQKLQEKKNERHQMELVQALSIDYNLVCFYDLDTGVGIPLRVDDEDGYMFSSMFSGENCFEESMERYIQENVYEADREIMREASSPEQLRNELAEKKLYHINYRIVHEGEIRYYEMKVVRSGEWEETHGAVFGFRSVDEETRSEMEKKRLLEDALLQANKANNAKSTFLSNMSHDIRTPMNAIVGFASLATAHLDSREQMEGYLKKITASGNHLLSLINDVLDMSQIESGKMQLEELPCSLSNILHDLNSLVQGDINAKDLSLNIDIVDVLDEIIYCDKLRLNQVLLNIISNSVKYTNAGGTVSLRVTEKSAAMAGYANYEFCIRDTGIGMSEEFVAHIFEPFERERNTTTSGIQGTGLGMAITKNIVDMMKGTIAVRSEQGKGTEVTVTFTFQLNPEARKPVEIAEFGGCRALVVDPNENTGRSTARLLEQCGMRAECTAAGGEALKYSRQSMENGEPYRVYMIDRKLKDMKALELIEKLRQEAGDEAAIILMAYDWAELEKNAREKGVTAFCNKPVFLSEVKSCLFAALGKEDHRKPECGLSWDKLAIRRILLAEDNELNQEIAVAILEDAGFEVEIAENGQIAVDMLKASEPGYYGVILMDVRMPEMNGYEATKAIRSLPDQRLASIPILAMTANAFEEDKQEALRSGMNGHIAKPIDVETLFGTMSKVLN